jgi:serine protease Do
MELVLRNTKIPSYLTAVALALPLLGWAPGVHAEPSTALAQLGPYAVADTAEKVTPAVVNITTKRNRRVMPTGHNPLEQHPMFREFFGPGMQQPPQLEIGAGSGVVISSDGFIVTNNHVIEGADEIKVAFSDKREFKAKLIGTDKPSDVALIKIDAKNLPALAFGDSNTLRLGEFVLAVGNPFGVGQTVTLGIVSAKSRTLKEPIVEYEDFIQTDAAINPGNSGGALVNLKGELVGINTAILTNGRTGGGNQGIGFAVPVAMVQPVLQQIKEHGRVRRGWLGIGIQDLTPELAKQMSIESTDGVLISDVMENGPGAKFDIKSGDIVVGVNGKSTKSSTQLRNAIALLGPGTKANLQIIREGKKKTIDVVLAEKKDEGGTNEPKETEKELLSGVQLQELSSEVRDELRIPPRMKGVVVAEIDPSSPAAESGLQPGDVITEVNRKPIAGIGDLRNMKLDKQAQALLKVWRHGSSQFVALHN